MSQLTDVVEEFVDSTVPQIMGALSKVSLQVNGDRETRIALNTVTMALSETSVHLLKALQQPKEEAQPEPRPKPKKTKRKGAKPWSTPRNEFIDFPQGLDEEINRYLNLYCGGEIKPLVRELRKLDKRAFPSDASAEAWIRNQSGRSGSLPHTIDPAKLTVLRKVLSTMQVADARAQEGVPVEGRPQADSPQGSPQPREQEVGPAAGRQHLDAGER